MSFRKISRDTPCLAVCWPACDAETVHVTFSRSNWETPGTELKRQPDGEFMCIIGATDPFEEILFKFIIDGTEWKVNRSFPVILDEYGYENNRWTRSEATAYHDFCILRLRRRITLAQVDQAELCRLALSIHGQTDKDGRQLECVVDETAPSIDSEASHENLMSRLLCEIVFLRFQPLGGQPDVRENDQLVTAGNEEEKDNLEKNDVTNETKISENKNHMATSEPQDKGPHVNDVWVAKFPADFLPHCLDGCKSISERERRMESECATLRFLNEHTKIPAPKIYAYDARYVPIPEDIPGVLAGHDADEFVAENKVGWPFILMGKPGAVPLLPYWPLVGDPCEDGPLSLNKNQLRKKIWTQMVEFQLELAKTPLAACGYLTLDCYKWQVKNKPCNRKNSTPKSAFGIRPCIYDKCIPFTDSIVSAFDGLGGRPLFPLARASNSLNSVTARFQHFLTHDGVNNKDHFVALWQFRSMIYDIFGACYENGPFILQHPDLFPQNIFVSGSEDESLEISGITNWEDTQAVPVQIAACPPRMLLGRLRFDNGSEPLKADSLFQTSVFPKEVLSRHQHEYLNSMTTLEDHMTEAGREPAIWKGLEGVKVYLSQVLRKEMVLPVYVLDELCSGSLYKSLTGDSVVKYFPLIYRVVKGHEWGDVKSAVVSKGAMQLALQEWEKKGKGVTNGLVADLTGTWAISPTGNYGVI